MKFYKLLYLFIFNVLIIKGSQEASLSFDLKKAILSGDDKGLEKLLEPGVNTKRSMFNLIYAMLDHPNKNISLSINEACANMFLGIERSILDYSQAEKILKLLLENDVDINSDASILFAAQRNCLNAIKLLLENGANVDMVNEQDGYTPIMYFFSGSALIKDREEIFNTFLKYKANINHQNKRGCSLIILLAEESYEISNSNPAWPALYEKVIFKLLFYGANLTLKSKYSGDFFNYLSTDSIALKTSKSFMNYVLNTEKPQEIKGAQNALLIAAHLNDVDKIDKLVNKGIWFSSKEYQDYFNLLISEKPECKLFIKNLIKK